LPRRGTGLPLEAASVEIPVSARSALFRIPGGGFQAAPCRPIDLIFSDPTCRIHEDLGMRPIRPSNRRLMAEIAALALIITGIVLSRPFFLYLRRDGGPTPGHNGQFKRLTFLQRPAPSLKGGVGWINSGPISLAELRGKIVLLDFWTFCCINCHHVLPDLAKLEEKYKNELVVIGVHTAKFEAERDTENIRRKVREYRIKHPVVNDANMAIWNRFGVQSWPTLVLIDANGNVEGAASGEDNYDILDRAIGELVQKHKARGELNLAPLEFTPEMERPSTGPLLFPGKVLADGPGKRLFISDTGHNRIIKSDLDGKNAVTIGSGEEAFKDGDFQTASFNRPQGMCVDGETLYVADTENHAIRAINLKEGKVTTVAGIGTQNHRIYPPPSSGPAKTTALSSPWDLVQLEGDKALYIAMAGPHQIWKLDLAAGTITVFAGTGREGIQDGSAASAWFAQPSGLATDGQNLFVADSEVSGIRVLTGIGEGNPTVHTLVGVGLFDYDDRDGRGAAVRLQHCLGLAYARGHLYIADTYNNRIKICEPKTRSVKSLVGSHKPGDSDDPPHFYEPGGLSAADSRLYVADTNNDKIRVVDLETHKVKTLELEELQPPRRAPRAPVFLNATVIDVPAVEAAPAKSIKLDVAIPLPKELQLNEESPLTYLLETPGKQGILAPEVLPEGQRIKPPIPKFQIDVPLARPAVAGDQLDLRLSLQTLVCSHKSSVCMIHSFIWNVPIHWSATGSNEPVSLKGQTK
jgi:thiol-disulfide isomerase/thioredoxin